MTTPVEMELLAEVAASVRRGEPPSDALFDELLPEGTRDLAGMFWTPVAVAVTASAWLDELGVGTVLDVGSGVGKFCVLAALSGKAHFAGVEHRARLVPLAEQLARALGVAERTRFLAGTLGQTPLPAVDAYYFYNPFGENVYGPEDHLDEDVLLTPSRFAKDVSAALSLLEAAPVGTVLVTYNGFGAHPPPSYRPLRTQSIGASELALLRRELPRRPASTGTLPAMRLAPIRPADLEALHALNQANVPHVGTLTLQELERVVGQSTVALGLWDDAGLVGMVLAMDPASSYQSPNYRWFCAKYERFLYVDRIAVAERARGQGLGRKLYDAIFAEARARGLERVTCEVNLEPSNPDSLAFHARLGFARVGVVAHVPKEKEVAMLAAPLPAC